MNGRQSLMIIGRVLNEGLRGVVRAWCASRALLLGLALLAPACASTMPDDSAAARSDAEAARASRERSTGGSLVGALVGGIIGGVLTGARGAAIGAPLGGIAVGATLEDFFPWPPPAASARTAIRPEVLADRSRFTTLGGVAEMLEGALKAGGFDEWGYFALPIENDSFGLVTKVEQIHPDTGKPLPGSDRWAPRPQRAAGMTFWESLTTIRRPTGHYRTFVFALSTRPVPDNPNETASLGLARRWTNRGNSFLPDNIRALPMTSDHRLTVRIYEFEHEDKGPSRLIESSKWTASSHLVSAGIDLAVSR